MSFFQSVSMAHQERVHSQVFAWIFSKECRAFNDSIKLKIISKITGTNFENEEIKSVQTEYCSMDIIIQTTNYVVAIENKIKTCTHSDQLGRYDQTLLKSFPNSKIIRLYFALFLEDIRNTNWKVCSHENICEVFLEVPKTEHNDKYILEDYLSYYKKLCWAYGEFSANPSSYSEVFKEGHISKQNRVHNISEHKEVLSFIFKNQLETLFQMAYLAKCSQTLLPDGYKAEPITESHGTALLNVPLGSFEFKGNLFEYGVQYQGKALKIFIAPNGYKNIKKGEVPESLLKIFNSHKFFTSANERTNKAKGKGFNSKTCELGWPYELNSDSKRIFIGALKSTEDFFKQFKKLVKAA